MSDKHAPIKTTNGVSSESLLLALSGPSGQKLLIASTKSDYASLKSQIS